MELLDQVSPWWWIAAAIALAAADMVIAPAVLVWAALAAFVVALILLTGTPARVREITRDKDTPNREVELRAAHPSVDAVG